MATESAMRLIEGSTAPTWPSSRDAIVFGSPMPSMGVDELRLLLKGHSDRAGQVDTIPNRSGSAPPSMEGSFAAIGNLLAQQDPTNSSLASLTSAFEKFETEEQLRSDPAYFAYYCSNVNLNPRLPPPLISRENRRLVRHMGGFGNNWRATSLDDTGSASLSVLGSSLPTHKEEPEDDRSPRHALTETRHASLNEQDTAFLMGRHKSLVDLIQEDFPRTPSPVYQSRTSGITKSEEPLDQDVHAVSSNISSINISETADLSLDSTCVPNNANTLDTHAGSLASSSGSVDLSVSSTESTIQAGILLKPEMDNNSTKVSPLEDDSSSCASQSVISRGDIRMRKKQDPPQSYGRNPPQRYASSEQGSLHQARVVQNQGNSRAVSHSNNLVERLNHGLPSPIETQPSLHPSGLAPPLYATAAYMTSGSAFYPNFQPPGLYGPQYSVGGYAFGSTLLPPYMTGYPSPGSVPVPFSSTSGSGLSFNDQTSGVSTGETAPHPSDLQNLGRFYGQHGLMLQPFLDPFHTQHLQHPVANFYGPQIQHGRLSLPAISNSPADSFAPKESPLGAYMGDQKLQLQLNGGPGVQSPGKVLMTSGYYTGPASMGVVTQFPTATLTSPVMPSSPIGGTSHIDRRSELRFPQSPSRNAGLYSGWQGQRGYTSIDDSKRHSFLEELKTSNARRFELSDITGRIVEYSVDQHGSRFIQQKLENCSAEDKDSVFKEVLPHASKLMTDVFGNYVIQKFFEHGSPEQRKELADQLIGQILPLCLQMYGCRVIQKALEVIELDQKIQLVHELDGHVLRCVRDQNGNHVIQKCIECVPIERIGFIISAFRNQVATLSTHPYGCRVIQRVLEHCSDEPHSQCIVDEILDAACQLAQDQYGNYVTQHVLERGKPYERSHIIGKLKGKIVQMSQHKYASNVIEKCLEYGDTAERELLIEEIIGQSEETDNLLVMMKDQFANYVVQKVLDVSNERQREILLSRGKVHLHALKKYTYGKHIAARFEQLFGEAAEGQSSEH